MQHVNPDQLVILSAKDKLLRWADLVRQYPHGLSMYSNLEYMRPEQLAGIDVRGNRTALAIAAHDPVFQAMGIGTTVLSVMEFFGISQGELHEFSCDCGGYIENREQADRITYLTNLR